LLAAGSNAIVPPVPESVRLYVWPFKLLGAFELFPPEEEEWSSPHPVKNAAVAQTAIKPTIFRSLFMCFLMLVFPVPRSIKPNADFCQHRAN
jgi:hypothetical protein